ncbi:histidine kinase [Pseudoflavitalea sp. G-6-1-2]|uniref:sensor histidine kinase n=1 Tax=Pseudoflavitalea sp. G-6-1-2 TaxID=2728841 RepID=UPI00146F37B0|nr:histidine kinase [Pseudoflavitalea sp. G-6-1-2]NML23850.1 histidine kinase [Pseudoflavitalea sp. G-6-1-2]
MSKKAERKSELSRSLLMILGFIGAGFIVFLVANIFTRSVTEHSHLLYAFLITVFVMMSVWLGRMIGQIWLARTPLISRKAFIWLAVIIFISIFFVLMAAALTPRASEPFIVQLFMGIPLLTLSISTGIAIKLIRASIKTQITDARTDAAQSQSELQLLQSQLSPHFLFNTLNNIYGTSLTRHEKVPPLLLKLSDLLRYSVYDARERFVPLQSELEYIRNYLEFEQLRIGEKLKLTVSIEDPVDSSVKIAPLLLIVFIENAFKHAKNTTEDSIQIELKIAVWGDQVLFFVKNSNNQESSQSAMLQSIGGFGLENVRRRLALLYPYQYELNIQNEPEHYSVLLQLKTK